MRRAALSNWTGIANVGGGHRLAVNDVIALVSELVAPVRATRSPAVAADVRDTAADITLARQAFGYRPTVDLRTGISAMAKEHRRMEVTSDG
jgi:nucleoside-diphosphate-sugar epimerase